MTSLHVDGMIGKRLRSYPKTFVGLMLAPFTYGSIKKEAERLANAVPKETIQPEKTIVSDK